MPEDTVDFFFANRPPNMFNELHRAHHIIVALGNTDRVDLVESAADEIRSSKDYANLFGWLSQDTFDNKTAILDLIRT